MTKTTNRRASLDLVTRAAATAPSTLDEESRTIDAVISTDQPVAVYDWRSRQIIDEVLVARGGYFPSQVPLFDSHFKSSASQLGSARGISQVDNGWRAKIHFAKNAGPHREESWEMVRQGHTTDVSIGYRYSSKDYVDIPPGERRVVDGEEYVAQGRVLRVVRKWHGVEVSTVPIGADDQAKMRAANGERSATDNKETPAIHVDTEKVRSEAVEAERTRIAAINGYRGTVPNDLIEKAIEEGHSVDQARGDFFDAMIAKKADEKAEGERREDVAPGHSLAGGERGPSGPKKEIGVLTAALLLRSGISIGDGSLLTPQAGHMLRSRGVDGGWVLNAARGLKNTGSLGQSEEIFDLAYRRQSMPMPDLVRAALEAEGVRCSSFDEAELMERPVERERLGYVRLGLQHSVDARLCRRL